MKFCTECGSPVTFKIPDGDHKQRAVCTQCHFIHYQNPNNIVCAIPIFQQQILLCRRGIEPRKGLWTLPGGFLENDETMQAGAKRESIEEAHLDLTMGRLFSVIDLPQYNQIHFFYLANLKTPSWQLTPESTEIQLFDFNALPWEHLAFKTVEKTLRHFVKHQNDYLNIALYESSINF